MTSPPLTSPFKILLLTSLLGVLPASVANAGQIVRASASCAEVGRIILSSDPGIATGNRVCERDQLDISRSRRVDVLCPTQRQVVQLQSGTHSVATLCNTMQARPRRCHLQSWLSCLKLRGEPQAQAQPRLQNPVGDRLMRPPSQLFWHPVSQATHYQVFIEGEGEQWMASVADPQLSLTDRNWTLKPEGAYLVTTVAYQGERVVSQSAKAVNILSEQDCKLTEARLASIQMLRLNPLEKISLADDLLVAENLVDESIGLLQDYSQQGYQSPPLLVRLGDRYLEAGQWKQAQNSYVTALSLPTVDPNDASLSRARFAIQQLQPWVAQ